MRLGANQSENPAIREFARTTAPVEFMVASGVSDLGQPSKSRDFEEATSKSYPVAICRCFRSSLRCSNGSWCSKTAPRSRTSNFPIEAADEANGSRYARPMINSAQSGAAQQRLADSRISLRYIRACMGTWLSRGVIDQDMLFPWSLVSSAKCS